MVTKKEVQDFIENFPNQKIKGKSIGDFLSYKNNSIWWFFKNRLEGDHLPTNFWNMEDVVRTINNNRMIPRKRCNNFLIRKGFYFNEIIKNIISRRSKVSLSVGKKVLCLVPTNRINFKGSETYVDRINKSLKEIEDDKELGYNLLLYDPQSKIASLNLFKHRNLIYQHSNIKILKLARAESKKLHKRWLLAKKNITFSSEIERKIFDCYLPAFDFIFSREVICSIIVYYETSLKVLKQNGTSCVLLDSFGAIPERVMIKAALSLNIPCLRLLHGGLYLPTREWEYPNNCYMCVHNFEVKNCLVEKGAKEDNVFVTGATFLEDFVVSEKKKNDGKVKKILFCTTSLVEENVVKKDKYFSMVSKVLKELKLLSKQHDIEVVLKLHPSEVSIQDYYRIINNLKLSNISLIEKLPKKELYDLINNSDLVISFFSTIILESSLLNKPTMLIDYRELPERAKRFTKDKSFVRLDPYKNTGATLREYLFNEKSIKELEQTRKKFVENFFYKNDGKVEERVINVIKSVIDSQSAL